MERFNPATAAQSLPGLVKDSHTCRYTNVGELTKAIQIKVFGGRGNVTQQGDLSALIKIKFSPPLSSLNLASLSLLHISVCSMFPITFPLSFLSLSAFLDFLLLSFPPILPFFCPSRPFCSPHPLVLSFLRDQQYHHKTGSLQQLLSLIKIKTKHDQNVNPVFSSRGALFLLHLRPLWSFRDGKNETETGRWGRLIIASDEVVTLHREDSWHSSALLRMTGRLP